MRMRHRVYVRVERRGDNIQIQRILKPTAVEIFHVSAILACNFGKITKFRSKFSKRKKKEEDERAL